MRCLVGGTNLAAVYKAHGIGRLWLGAIRKYLLCCQKFRSFEGDKEKPMAVALPCLPTPIVPRSVPILLSPLSIAQVVIPFSCIFYTYGEYNIINLTIKLEQTTKENCRTYALLIGSRIGNSPKPLVCRDLAVVHTPLNHSEK